MENIENSAEKADCIDLENILKAMDSLSKSMDELVCMYLHLLILFTGLYIPEMSVRNNYSDKMTLNIDLQICKVHDVILTLDL